MIDTLLKQTEWRIEERLLGGNGRDQHNSVRQLVALCAISSLRVLGVFGLSNDFYSGSTLFI